MYLFSKLQEAKVSVPDVLFRQQSKGKFAYPPGQTILSGNFKQSGIIGQAALYMLIISFIYFIALST